MEFEKYRRKQIAELRPLTEEELNATASELKSQGISVSDADIENGSPKSGDMIARNPKNHDDRWLVAAQYFNDNFEPL